MTAFEELIKRTQTEEEIAKIALRLREIVTELGMGVHVDVSYRPERALVSVYIFPEGEAPCSSFHITTGDEMLGAIEKAINKTAEVS